MKSQSYIRPHSGPLPQERENRLPGFGSASAPGLQVRLNANFTKPATVIVPPDFLRDTDGFTLSPGERAGVRASVYLISVLTRRARNSIRSNQE
jgi:hypothetical protein